MRSYETNKKLIALTVCFIRCYAIQNLFLILFFLTYIFIKTLICNVVGIVANICYSKFFKHVPEAFSETTYEGSRHVMEGGNFTISCHPDKIPVIEWHKNDVRIDGSVPRIDMVEDKENSDKVYLLNVYDAQKSDAGNYKCFPHDNVSHEIIIISGFSEDETVKNVDVGVNVVLTCNSTIGVTWNKDSDPVNVSDNKIIIHENSTLEIKNITDEDAGTYYCHLNVSGDSTQNQSQSFQINTKPRILEPRLPKSSNQVQGDRLLLKCQVAGNPVPTVRWVKNEEENIEANETGRTEIKWDADAKLSSLIIQDLKDEDRAHYMCIAENVAGSVNSTSFVRVKDKLAALWPFLGIVAEVAVLCTIIFIYEKRRTKQDFEESDTDQSPDTKNVSDNKDKDVRQRK